MKLFALVSLFFVLSSNHLTYGDEKPKKLQIGVKKRVENCDQRSRRGDVLSMHYTVRFFFHSVQISPKMSHFYVQNIVMYFDFRGINADFNGNFWREKQIYLICERL